VIKQMKLLEHCVGSLSTRVDSCSLQLNIKSHITFYRFFLEWSNVIRCIFLVYLTTVSQLNTLYCIEWEHGCDWWIGKDI